MLIPKTFLTKRSRNNLMISFYGYNLRQYTIGWAKPVLPALTQALFLPLKKCRPKKDGRK